MGGRPKGELRPHVLQYTGGECVPSNTALAADHEASVAAPEEKRTSYFGIVAEERSTERMGSSCAGGDGAVWASPYTGAFPMSKPS